MFQWQPALCVSLNCEATDPSLGVLKIRNRFLNLAPSPISFLIKGISFNQKNVEIGFNFMKLLRLKYWSNCV